MSGAATRARASGKVVLLGEHAVVYGRPALVAGVPLGLEVEARLASGGPRLEGIPPELRGDERPHALVAAAGQAVGLDPRALVVHATSDLPPGRGFGSSAALAVAVLRACAALAGRALGDAELLDVARRLEGIFHGRSSGIDPAAAALGGVFRFVRGEPPLILPLCPGRPVELVVAWGARPRRTGATVGELAERWAADRARYEAWFDAIAAVVTQGEEALVRGETAALGAALDENQRLLEAIGVSSPEVEALVAAARAGGARGAKLTGGGAGGAVIALADDAATLAASLRSRGAAVQVVVLTGEAERAA